MYRAYFVSLLFLPFVTARGIANEIIDYKWCDPESTTSPTFFDSSTYACSSCAGYIDPTETSKVVSTSSLDAFGMSIGCECPVDKYTKPSGASCGSTAGATCAATTCDYCANKDIKDGSNNDKSTVHYPTADDTTCLPCVHPIFVPSANNLYIKPTVNGKVCSCGTGNNHALSGRDSSGKLREYFICQKCSDYGRVFAESKYICIDCPDVNMTWSLRSGATDNNKQVNYECKCKTGFVNVGDGYYTPQRCVDSTKATALFATYPEASAVAMTYSDSQISDPNEYKNLNTLESVNSALIKAVYGGAAFNCFHFTEASDIQYCQALSNICVLQYYNSDSVACKLYKVIYAARTLKKTIPWLFYSESPAAVLQQKNIPLKLAFYDTASDVGKLHMTLSKYDINGHWKGFEKLVDQFWYCPGHPMPNYVNENWLEVATSVNYSYSCDLNALIAANGTKGTPSLYEAFVNVGGKKASPYEGDPTKTSTAGSNEKENAKDELYSVPLRNINLQSNGSRPNNSGGNIGERDPYLYTSQSDDIFTTRFFLYDVSTAVTDQNGDPKVVRYADQIALEIHVYENDEGEMQMYPPILNIHYVERSYPFSSTDMSKANVNIRVDFVRDYKSFWEGCEVMFSFAVISWIMMTTFRTINTAKKQSHNPGDFNLDGDQLLNFLKYAVTTMTKMSFPWFMGIMFYWLFFFKFSAAFHTVVPPTITPSRDFVDYYDLYGTVFEQILCTLWVAQLFRILEILKDQTNSDMFLIDWEKSQGFSDDYSNGGHGKRLPRAVSVWRSIVIANEFNERQAIRKTSVEFTLFCVLILLEVFNLKYLDIIRPDPRNLSQGVSSPYLRCANDVFWYLLVVIAQRLWIFIIQDRFISEPAGSQLVDLCTTANISILLLDSKFHGYYIHGRSPHPYSDVNMVQMMRDLKQETEDNTAGRGLGAPGAEEEQTFELFVTEKWRDHYDAIYGSLWLKNVEASSAMAQMEQGNLRLGRLRGGNQWKTDSGSLSDIPPEKLVAASRILQNFLKAFFSNDNASPKTNPFRYRIEEPNFLTHNFGVVPPSLIDMRKDPTTCMLLPDVLSTFHNPGFEKLLFLGVEYDLVLFDIMNLCFFHYWLNDLPAAIIITYFFAKAASIARQHFGAENVSSKCLLDKRFLI